MSQAVLIGVSSYSESDRWAELPAVEANLTELRRTLTSRAHWGLDPHHCNTLSNPSDPTTVLDAIYTAAEQALDTVFIYYAGHGTIRDNKLLLTLSRSSGVD